MSDAVINVKDLVKSYRSGFRLKRVDAVNGVTFDVKRGEIFGFVGPNGAGKTTTIRVLMGLIRATQGECRIFDHVIPSRDARKRLGFLPEAPYFYDYLSVAELLDLVGRLFGIDRAERRRRAARLVELVGLGHARDMAMKKYSKGMLQRAGIAQALVNDPELVVFDEPMSGLDPVGRKEVRDIILSLRDEGKTVFFSSHILSDVEMVCDRIAIIVKGRVRDVGNLTELVETKIINTEVSFRVDEEFGDEAIEALRVAGAERVRRVEREIRVVLPATADVDEYLVAARQVGARVRAVTPHHETLEDLFIRSAREEPSETGDAA